MIHLLLLINSFLISEGIDEKITHFNVSNNYLNVLSIGNGEFIFYGSNGGVLRTFDAGITWAQNYSATDSNILDMIYNNGILYGVSTDGKVIVSKDKGEFWEAFNFENEILTSIAKIDNSIYVSSVLGNIYMSIDEGINWIKKYELKDTVWKLINHRSDLFIRSSNNKNSLKIIKSGIDEVETFEIPEFAQNSYFEIHIKKGNFYISNYKNIAKLNINNSWELFDINILGNFNFIPVNNDTLYLFYTDLNNSNISVFKYAIDSKEMRLIKKYDNLGLSFEDYKINSVAYDGLNYFISMPGKTILKSTDLNEGIEILSTMSYKNLNISNVHFIDINNWILPRNGGKLSNLGANIVKTTNKGRTFKLNKTYIPIDFESSIYPVYPKIEFSYFKDINNGVLLFSGSGGSNQYKYKIGKTTDGGSTFQFDSTTNIIGSYLHDFKFNGIKYYLSYLFVSRKINFYKINNNLEFDYLGSIDSLGNNLGISIFCEKDKFWIFGQDRTNQSFFVANSDSNFQNWSTVYKESSEGFLGHFNMFKQGQRIFFNIKDKSTDTKIYEFQLNKGIMSLYYSSKLDRYQNIEYENFQKLYSINSGTDFDDLTNNYYLHTYYIINQSDTTLYKNIVKLNFDNKLDIDSIYSINPDKHVPIEILYQQLSGKYSSFSSSIGNIYIPMDSVSIKYYNSIEKKYMNFLDLQLPYPQPSNVNVKLKVFWDTKIPFDKNNILIYNIYGDLIKTEKTLNIEYESNNSAHINWNHLNQSPGIYFIKVRHGTELQFQKILISK